MSKAFTREDGEQSAPVLPPGPRLAPGEQRYVTPEGHARLEAELRGLEADLVATPPPASGAERSADVRLHRRDALVRLLSMLTVVAPRDEPDRVHFGVWVGLEDDEGEHVVYRLVGPDEVDVKAGRISVDAPLGRALLGREVGESVRVQLPRGTREFTVVSLHAREP